MKQFLRRVRRRAAAAAALGLVAGLTTGCGDDPDPTVEVLHPPAGAAVSLPFEVNLSASVPLGSPDEDHHHLHIWFGDDDSAYLVVETDRVEIVSAPIGEHAMHVSLRHADHSDTGVATSVPLIISAG